MYFLRLMSLVTIILSPRIASAAKIYVDAGSGNPSPPYATLGTAARSISSALSSAANGDVILVAPGTYVLGSPILVQKGVVIRAMGSRSATVVDGASLTRCFDVRHADARVDGFTITRGKAELGGGVRLESGVLINCVVMKNQAVGPNPKGGGVHATSKAIVRSCVISDNVCESNNADEYDRVSEGAGVYASDAAVEDSQILRNTGHGNYVSGGGACLVGARLVNTKVEGNVASAVWYASGGGVYGQWGAEIERCTITGNRADVTEEWVYSAASADGGGIYIGNGTLTGNSLIAGNRVYASYGFCSGGGAWVSGSTLFHCTIVGNEASPANNPSKAGGVMWGYLVNCKGTIIWGNSASTGSNENYVVGLELGPAEVKYTYSLSDVVHAGAGNRSGDPLLVNPVLGDYRLSVSSQCVDAAMPKVNHSVDLAGLARPFDGDQDGIAVADIGCHEFGSQRRPAFCDFDGDGRTDPAVMRAADGSIRIFPSQTWRVRDIKGGKPAWQAVVADYDGDRVPDAAWFDPSTGKWYIRESSRKGALRLPLPVLGKPDDRPVPADFDGDGKADLAIQRASDGRISVIRSRTGTRWTPEPGKPSWIAIAADYDGDGKADPAWYEPGLNSKWHIHLSGNRYAPIMPLPTYPKGSKAIPVAGDFDGDGIADRALFNTSSRRYSVKESQSGLAWTSAAGEESWRPVPGDFNGDGFADCGWFDPASGLFHVLHGSFDNSDNSNGPIDALPGFGVKRKDRPISTGIAPTP